MKKSPITRAIVLVLTLALVCTSVLAVPQTAEAASKPKEITLSAKKRTLYVGKSFTLKVKSVKPAKASKAVTFKSSNTKVATVSAKGKVTAKKVGKATITVTSSSNKKVSAKCKITVKQQVETIQVKNSIRRKVVVPKGKSLTLKTVVKPDNAADKGVNYIVRKPKIITVSAKGKVKANKYGSTRVAIQSKDKQKKTVIVVFVPRVRVKSIKFDVSKKSLNVGKSYQLKEIVKPSNASVKVVEYKSSNPKVASVCEFGKVTARKPGKAVITAVTLDGKKKAKCTITVNPVKVKGITVVPESQKIFVGQKFSVSAKITPADATNPAVTWTTSDAKVVTITQSGDVTAVGVGEADIIATAKDGSGKTGKCRVTVEEKCPEKVMIKSIEITSNDIKDNELKVGQSGTLQTKITLTDGTVVSEADKGKYPLNWWVSDRPEVASVDMQGRVTALKEGTAHINALAKDGSGVIGTYVLKVVKADEPPVKTPVINLTDKSVMNLAVNGEGTRDWSVTDADAADVKWISTDTAIATVTAANGKLTVKGVAQGTVDIKGSVEGGETVSFKVNVFDVVLDKTELSMKSDSAGEKLTATVRPGSAADLATVEWSSSDTSVATVDNTGLVKPVKLPDTATADPENPRKAVITATVKVGAAVVATATCNVTVIDGEEPPVEKPVINLPDKSDMNLILNEEGTRDWSVTNAEPSAVTWTSSNDSIATVTKGEGRLTVKGVAPGTVTITGTVEGGEPVSFQVIVSDVVKPVINMADKSDMNLAVNGEGSRDWSVANAEPSAVTWASSDDSIATVTKEEGKLTVKGVAPGTVTITGTVEGGEPVSFQVNVFGVTLDKAELTMKANAAGETLNAAILPESAASLATPEWASSDESVAIMDNGLVKPVQLPITAVPDPENPRKAVITVTLKVGEAVVATASCDVTVIDEENAFIRTDTEYGYNIDKSAESYRVEYPDRSGSTTSVSIGKDDVMTDVAELSNKLKTWTWDNDFLKRYWGVIDADTLRQGSAVLGSLLWGQNDLTVTDVDDHTKRITFQGRTVEMKRIDGEQADSLIFTEIGNGNRTIYVNNIQAQATDTEVVFQAQVGTNATSGASFKVTMDKDVAYARLYKIANGTDNRMASVQQTESNFEVRINATYYNELVGKYGEEYDVLSKVSVFNSYSEY